MAGITVVVHFGARPMLAAVVYLLSIFKTHRGKLTRRGSYMEG